MMPALRAGLKAVPLATDRAMHMFDMAKAARDHARRDDGGDCGGGAHDDDDDDDDGGGGDGSGDAPVRPYVKIGAPMVRYSKCVATVTRV